MALKLKANKQEATNEALIEQPLSEGKLPITTDPIVERRRGLTQNSMRDLERAGLPLPIKPGQDAPRLPGNINDLADDELGYYMSTYSRWCEYADYVVAHADVKHAMAASSHEYVSAKVRLGKTGTVQDKSAKLHADLRYQESLMEMESAFATLRLAKSLLAGYQKLYEALSREITRRQNQFDRRRG